MTAKMPATSTTPIATPRATCSFMYLAGLKNPRPLILIKGGPKGNFLVASSTEQSHVPRKAQKAFEAVVTL